MDVTLTSYGNSCTILNNMRNDPKHPVTKPILHRMVTDLGAEGLEAMHSQASAILEENGYNADGTKRAHPSLKLMRRLKRSLTIKTICPHQTHREIGKFWKILRKCKPREIKSARTAKRRNSP
jgi:hypothetical protein